MKKIKSRNHRMTFNQLRLLALFFAFLLWGTAGFAAIVTTFPQGGIVQTGPSGQSGISGQSVVAGTSGGLVSNGALGEPAPNTTIGELPSTTTGEPGSVFPQQPGIAGLNSAPLPPPPNIASPESNSVTSFSNTTPANTSLGNTLGTSSETQGLGNNSVIYGGQPVAPGPTTSEPGAVQ